ncbi:MAG: rane protein [Verrucomicrobiales bacterium]|nr:rane protein [Verrucomicrobiales bacterium]
MELIAALLIAGVVLMLLELILPGMVAGIVGFGCLVAAVIMSYSRFGSQTGNLILLCVVVALIGAAILWVRFFPDSPMARPFISKTSIGNIGAEKPELLNQTGTAHTTLRPSGTAVINGQRVDVVTEGTMIDRGTPIKVVQIEGMRVVVRAI